MPDHVRARETQEFLQPVVFRLSITAIRQPSRRPV